MQIYLSLMSQKNPSSDSSSYDLSSPQGRMLYVRETTNAAFSSWTSPLQRQDPDTQEEKKQEMLSRIMGKLKSGKKLSAKELDFLRRTDPILYAHALRVQRMAEALKQQLSHAKSKQEANDMITSAIAGVSDKDPDKEYLLAAYNEVSKNFHKSPAYQRLPNTPEDAKKRKTNNPNAHFSDDEDTNDDTDDLLSWTPLQEIIGLGLYSWNIIISSSVPAFHLHTDGFPLQHVHSMSFSYPPAHQLLLIPFSPDFCHFHLQWLCAHHNTYYCM